MGRTSPPHLTTQQYGGGGRIDGVKILDLRLLTDDGGSFAELVRFDEEGNLEAIPEFKVRQSSYSLVLPGAIKAFHLHFNQEDVWFVPPTDRLLIGLVDARKDSPTYQATMRFVMGGGPGASALHPARGGAWRRQYRDCSRRRFCTMSTSSFDLQDPDERRLPWDIVGADFWQMTPG